MSRKSRPPAAAPAPSIPEPAVVARARRRVCNLEGCRRGCWDTADVCRLHLAEHLAGMTLSDDAYAALVNPAPAPADAPATTEPAADAAADPKEQVHG